MHSSPWGHDTVWEHAIVRKIREDGRAPEVYALYEGAISHETGERAGLATGVVYYDVEEAEERVRKNKDFRESLRNAQEAAKVRNAKEVAERKAQAELRRIKRAAEDAERAEHHARLEREARQRREDYERNRPIEIAERVEHADQERRILASKWACTVCGGKSYIERQNPGYRITCMSCEKQAWGSHKSLWEILSK